MDSLSKVIDLLNHYEYYECDEGYCFTTDKGNVYLVSFSEYPINVDLLQTSLYMLNIDRLKRNIGMGADDERVRNTILKILYDFFNANDNAMISICESGDGGQLARFRLFNRWFEQFNNGFLCKCDATFSIEGELDYASLFYKKDSFDSALLILCFEELKKMNFYF